tara:strand:+ start:124 stop:435 length:312 start_codon:yes stop_codon:yes gene_type:complete
MSKSRTLYDDPNVVVFGGKITEFLEGQNTHGNTKVVAKLVNSYQGGRKSFDTSVGVTAYGTQAKRMTELYESHSYCLVHGRLASNKEGSVFIIPTQVYDGGAE